MAAVCGAEDWRIEREAGRIGLDEGALDRPLNTLSGGGAHEGAALSAVPHRGLRTPHRRADQPSGRGGAAALWAATSPASAASSSPRTTATCSTPAATMCWPWRVAARCCCAAAFPDYLRERERREAMERAEEERLRGGDTTPRRGRRRAGEWAGRAEKAKHRTSDSDGRPERGYQGHKAAKMVKRAKGIERRREEAVEQKSQLLRHVDEAGEVRLRPAPCHAERLCGLENATVRFDGRAALRGRRSDHFARRARGAAGRQRLRQDHGAAAFDGRTGGGRGPRLARRRACAFPSFPRTPPSCAAICARWPGSAARM